ncbi:MAG TPA: acyltransferase [Gemmatimonadaceae bacterium]|jgi:acetyltransferase-like isoleucine patch superfamily enzyme|nr:acyltransferase [Gemmatimonadaceae bacterium]
MTIAREKISPDASQAPMSGLSRGSALRIALRHPGTALSVARDLARGKWYKLWYPMRGIRFEAGRNLRVSGRLIVRGPGRVIFGDNVHVDAVVTPWTLDANAVIRVGDGSYVNGTRFSCQQEITIGARALLSDARILDTDFHSTMANRHDPSAPVRAAPIRIEENVWIAMSAGILPGTCIGANSVVGYGAVCAGVYPANSIIVGNPAKVVRSIPESADV